jgi:hypothetical protein
VDGVLQNKSIGISGQIKSNVNSSIVLGRDPRIPANRWLNGKIDQVQIYSRALGNEEIQAVFNEQQSYFNNTFTTCDTTALGVDTTNYIGPNGCEVTDINITSLQSPVNNNALIAYYPFDGNTHDGSGYGRHGIVNGATLTADRWGQTNSAYGFDGNDWIGHPTSNALNVGNGDFSISVWVKRTQAALNSNTLQRIVSKQDVTSNYRGFYLRFNTNDVVEFATNYAQWYGNGSVTSSIAITDLNWHLITGVLDGGSGKIKLFIDGILQNSAAGSNNYNIDTNAEFYFGKVDGLNESFFGVIDDPRFFKRALSANEVNSLYNQHLTYTQSCDIADIGRDTIVLSSSTACDSIQNIVTSLQSPLSNQDMVAFYSFDGNANDMSGWGSNGTVSGATLSTDREGNANSAYGFDGVNDYINIPSSTQMSFAKISIAGWIKLDQNIGNTQARISCRQGAGSFDNWGLQIYGGSYGGTNGGNDLVFHTSNGSITTNYIYDANLAINQWIHVAAVNDFDSVRIYINGLKKVSYLSNGVLPSNINYPILIGQTFGGGFYFPGSIDDIYFFKRPLLSTEILALYNSSSFLFTNTLTSCDTANIGIDTSYYAGGSNGCDSTVVTITSLQSPVSNNGLAAYYTLDGSAGDFSGYDRNATVTGATLTQDRHGNANSAYAFNGSNQYLSTDHDPSLNPASSSYGVSLHFKTNATGQRELFMKTSVGSREFALLTLNNGNINVELGKGATSYYCNTTGLTLNDNVWHHLFFQRAPGSIKDTLRIYVDGVLKKQEIYGAVLSFNPAEKMYIGIRKNWNGGGLQFPFMGSIDGVMVWNRTLTPAEIQSLANERKGGPQTLVQRDTTHDYGTVMVGEAPVFTTFITNTTCDTLTINDLYTTNSAFTTNTQAGAILPYASKKIEVSFAPTAEVPYAGELKVESNGDTLTYALTGNGCNLCACPTEDVVLTTQAGLDAFVAYYGGCDSLPVSLTLAGTSSIHNITGLGFIKHIDGHLTINGHTVLPNLNGFGNLQGLTGSLSITNNALITQVDSLHELAYIGQSLTISQNAALTNLNGLNNLDGIGQNILITNNAALNDCDAICPAWNAGISGSLTISNNPSECSTVTQFRMVCDDDCTIGDLVLTSQAEVNTFINTYSGCDTLIGNLTISGGSSINNIHGLSFIRQITGNLTLTGNANLSNMKGLQGLVKITGSLTVTGHVNMVSLDSLHHLQAVLGSVSIQNNAVLNEVNALGSLDTIGGNLNINNNLTLYDCSGLCPVINNDAIEGNISISNNPNNCSTTEEVVIYCTPPMCPVTGNFILTNQAEVNAFVANFNACDSLIGNLTIIGGNDIVSINGLNFLRHIGGYLTIKNNYKLTHMQGFGNLQKVAGNFTIEGNPLVSSLGHLDSLQHVGGFLKIQNNNALPNLSGLQFLNHIGNNLIVRNNGALGNCSVICTLLDNGVIQGVIDVASNPSACSNNAQVNAVCTYGSLLSKVMISIPQDSIAEGSVFTFTVSTDYPPADTLTVNLASNNQTEVPVPATTKILPNTTSKQVTITLPNDNVPEKQKSVTLTGGAPYLTAGSDQFVLTDNADMPDINLVISLDTLSEGAGPYATPAIVSRAFTDGTTMNITLTSSHPGLTLMPTGVNLAPNELQKQIFIGVADNVSVDTLRKVTITARYIIPSCICPAPDNSVGVAKDQFVVSDDDGPTLTIAINPLSMEEGKTNAGTLTITRNTATNVPLTVNLSHNDQTELSLPATATFPIGALSINVPINTLNDPIEDGNQQVIITVAAPGFVSASTWAIVTDINKPDLVITALESLDPQLTLGEQLPYKVYIYNKGLSASARGISLVGYLSVDGSISSDDILLGNYFMDVAIPAGDTVVYGGIGNLPAAPGTYYLIFRVNPNQTITELLYLNNTSAPLAINVQADYTATASVNKEVYIIGEPVLISGSSYDLQNQKLPNTAVEIYVLTGNHRREIDVVTNAQGDYLYTLHPLLSERGHFTVGAGYPNLGLTAVQDEYDILGVRLNNGNYITWNMMLGDTINGSLPITNVSGVAMTQVTLSPQSLPNGCLLTFDTLPTLPANGSLLLPYQVVAGALTPGTAYLEIPLNIHANDTVIQQDRAYYFVKAQLGHLKASIASINTQLGPAANKVIEFEIENIGQGTINEVNISVPTVTWLRLVSVPQITNMVPGEKKTVTLEFMPTAQLPFNTPASGNIAINTTNANGISLPFSVMKVSNQTGTMTIDVIDQFTYFSPGSPHVDSARVRISNYFTGQLYADGLTGEDGKYIATNLPQGQLRIVVDAIRHKSYDGIITVVPGTNQTEVVFVEYQAISFTWDVTPTQIEDEYEIDLIMKFESNVPIPVVTMAMPDTLPQLTGNQTYAFNITMTNVGLITAKEVQLDLPDDNEYEFITTYQQQDILAQQAIQVPVVMKKRNGGGNFRGSDDVVEEANRRLGIGMSKQENAATNSNHGMVSLDFKCGSDELHHHLMDSSSAYEREYTQFLKSVDNNSSSIRNSSSLDTIVIPVAFHFGEGMTNANMSCINFMVDRQIEALNRDFSAQNEDLLLFDQIASQCSLYFDASARGIGTCIRFRTANFNHPIDEGLNDGDRAYTFNKYTYQSGAPAWQGYLNFFINNDVPVNPNTGVSDPTILGLEPRPIPGMESFNYGGKGIWIKPNVFGGGQSWCVSGDTLNNVTGLQKGRVAVHEVGHYFGLHHPFSNPYVNEAEGDCIADDGFDDTPSQKLPNGGFPIVDYTDCFAKIGQNVVAFQCGTRDFFFNHMDYTIDDSRIMFTADQSTWMNSTASLNHSSGTFKTDVFCDDCLQEFSGNCFDIVYADFSYQCGGISLSEVTATQFRYNGRDCKTPPTIVINDSTNEGDNNGTGPGGPGGPGVDGTNINTNSNVPPVISVNEECLGCLKDILREAFGCIPGVDEAFAIANWLRKPTLIPPVTQIPGTPIPLVPPIIKEYVELVYAAVEVGECIQNPSLCSCGGLIIKSAPLGCLLGIVCTAEECGLLPQNPLLSGFGRSTLFDLPSALVEPLENLQITVTALETRLNTYSLIYDSLLLHENFDQLNNEFLPYVFNHQLINSNDSVQLLLEMLQFDFDTVELVGLISKYNASRRQWNNGNYPNSPQFINWLKLDSLENKLIFIDSIIGERGYNSHENMLLSSIDEVREYSIEEDPTQNAVCASTSIALSQKFTMTREAFEGTLKVFNGSVTDQMDSIKLDLVILNEQGVVSNDLFEIDTSALELITGIDGTGTLAANAEGTAKIIFIPEIGAAPTIPKYYSFGGSLSYRDPFSGLSTTMPLVPVTLQVNPSPNLYLHYFLQRDIISDDPLTSPIEPTIPASLALMIENNGYGIATNLKIQSAQPQVIDNDKGLALNMNFTGSKIQGQPANMGLTNINFGNINPLSTKVGEWIFTSNVLGHFTGYQTSVRHLSSRGNPDLSLVEGASLHEWIKSIKVYDTQSDGINDFLVNEVPDAEDHPDAIYLSQGNLVLDVEYAQAGSFLTPITYPTFTNTLTVDPSDVGWNYLKLNDPGHGDYNLLSVTRNQDNQAIPLDNAWLTFVTIPDTRVPVYENKFHFVDVFSDTLPRTYTVVWSPKDPTPPYVDTIIGAPLQVSTAKVNQITVVFSEEIVDSTFTIADIAFYNQGGPNLIDTSVTITKVDSVTYTIDITTKTNTNGYFVFKVETIGISDLSGAPGFYAKQVSWTQFLTVPVITDYIDFPLRGISAAYDTVKIKFNLPLDTAVIQANDFFLVKDGNQLTGTMGLSLVSAELKTFRLTHMDTLFMEDGLYALGVDLKSIKSTTNVFGLDTQYYAFIVDNQRPDVDTLIKLYSGSLDPQHVTGIKVIFDEDIVSFDTTSVTLYRGLSAQGLSPMDIIEVSPKEYDVLWTLDASYVNGSYKFVIDESKFEDLTMIQGFGMDSLSWITSRNSNLLFTNVKIVPDYGFSDTDGITYNTAGNLRFSINENASNIRLYQQDNTNTLTLLSSLASGAANVTLTMPYAVVSSGNTKLVLKAYDQYQNEVSYTKSILIDQSALQAAWALPQNLSFTVHPDSININFNRRVLDYTPNVYSTLTLFKDNVGISSTPLEITELNDSTFRVSGFSTIANEPGDYKLAFKIDSFAKYLSGLPGSGNVDLYWEIANSNLVPIANAGPDLTIKDMGQVTLDGSLSSDPNGDSLSYLWYALDDIQLSNDSVINPSLVVNESHLGKVLTFLLVVNDGIYTASDLVRIYIQLDDIILRPKVFLEGPFSSSTGMMSDQLRQSDVIPLQNPYIDTLKYVLGNDGKFIDTTILEITGNNAVVDWVYLELYNATLDSTVRGGSFLLQRDGDIVDVDNESTVKFLDLNEQHNHHLRIYHRNHLSVETSAGVSLPFSTIQILDLRYDQSKIKGSLNGIKKTGQYVTIFSGDINQNGQVQNTDLNLVLPKIGQAGYKMEDADMNGTVEQADIQVKMIPNLGRGKQF